MCQTYFNRFFIGYVFVLHKNFIIYCFYLFRFGINAAISPVYECGLTGLTVTLLFVGGWPRTIVWLTILTLSSSCLSTTITSDRTITPTGPVWPNWAWLSVAIILPARGIRRTIKVWVYTTSISWFSARRAIWTCTWLRTCAPRTPSAPWTSWWISWLTARVTVFSFINKNII